MSRVTQNDVFNFNKINKMRADGLHLANLAFQACQRALQHRLRQRAFLPAGEGKALLHRHTGHPGEMASHDLLLMVQHVNAQPAVTLKYRIHGAVGVDAHHHRRRGVRDRADGGGGNAAAACLTLGGHHIHRGRQAGHGVAKTQALF